VSVSRCVLGRYGDSAVRPDCGPGRWTALLFCSRAGSLAVSQATWRLPAILVGYPGLVRSGAWARLASASNG